MPDPENRVVAVVPLFRPSEQHVAELATLAAQVQHVVAVDDGSPDPSPLDAVARATTTVIRMEDNGGIARCLNEGVRAAERLGATHVLTMDQDSKLGTDYVRNALQALADLRSVGVGVGGIGAGIVGTNRVEGRPVTQSLRDGIRGVQSGWLIPIQVFDEIGMFDERLFIDCVDVDFLVRAGDAGRPVLVTDRCVIEHSLGSEERTLRLFGRRLVFSVHPPFRRYYITRNRLVMLLRYGLRRSMVEQSLVAIRIALLGVVFGSHRRAQLRAILAGIVHALQGRLGEIPAGTRRALERVAG